MSSILCAFCEFSNAPPAVRCKSCNHVLPFYEMNPFLLFQLEPTLKVDACSRDECYFDLQKKLHPDKLQQATNMEQTWAEQHISQINQAYKIIKNTVLSTKAAYLYFRDQFLPLDRFKEEEIPTPSADFLQLIMTIQINEASDASTVLDSLHKDILEEIEESMSQANLGALLNSIGRLTYIDRLRTLKAGDSSC